MSRRYQEQVDVRLGEPQVYGVRLEQGWCRGAVDEAFDPQEVPTTFLWRGRVHIVRGVLAQWTQRVPWWRGIGRGEGAGLLEQQVWRVEASAGRAFGTGVYDLVRGERWSLERVSD